MPANSFFIIHLPSMMHSAQSDCMIVPKAPAAAQDVMNLCGTLIACLSAYDAAMRPYSVMEALLFLVHLFASQ
jgi:hypothetical protein